MSSGLLVGGLHPVVFARRLEELGALVADVGAPCWLYGPTSGALFGFDGYPLEPPYHLVVERGRYVTRLGHVIHTTTSLPLIDRSMAFGFPTTSGTRTIIDLARSESDERLTLAFDSATRDGHSSDDFLHRRLVALRGSGRVGATRLLRVLGGIEVTRGGHSWLERTFLAMVAVAGLPAPLTQQVLARRGTTLVRVDCRFAGTPVVVELLGYTFHRTLLQLRVDAARANALLLAGLQPLQFSYLDVVEEPERVMVTLRQALAPHLAGVRVSS